MKAFDAFCWFVNGVVATIYVCYRISEWRKRHPKVTHSKREISECEARELLGDRFPG